MPPATKVFDGIASQGPFQEYLSQPLQSRPIDAPRQPFSGQESTPVAIGDIALDFLKGIRTNRVANFIEQERNNQMGLDQFRAYVTDKLQNPDLTDEGRKKITDAAYDVINRHMHYELRDAPKEGVAGFFKNLLTNLSGGPIKTREPINWAEARGQISQAAAGYSQSANLQKGVQKAMETIRQMRAAGATAPEIQSAISSVAAEVGTTAPAHTKTFWDIVGPVANVDPLAEEVNRQALALARSWRGGAAIPQTQPPPVMMPQAPRDIVIPHPVAGDLVAPGKLGTDPVGVTLTNYPAPAPFYPSTDVRPAETSAVSPTGPVPTMPAMDLRSPITQAVLAKFGRKVGSPTTIFAPGDTSKYETGVVRGPFSGRWEYYDRPGVEVPESAQQYIPHDEYRQPTVPADVVVWGSEDDNPNAVSLNPWILNKGTGVMRPTATQGGKRVFGPGQPLEDMPGAGGIGVIRGTRGQAAGKPVPLTPVQQHEVDVDKVVGNLLVNAKNDPLLAQEMAIANAPDNLKADVSARLSSEFRKLHPEMQARYINERRKRQKGIGTAPPPQAPVPPPPAAVKPVAPAAVQPPSVSKRLR